MTENPQENYISKTMEEIENQIREDEKLARWLVQTDVDQIVPRLYLCSDSAATNKEVIDFKHITHIINVTFNIPNVFEPLIVYQNIVVKDLEDENLSEHFSSTYEFIEKALNENASNNVLVHCNAGISRSASIVISYLLQKRKFANYKDAYAYVKARRPIIYPNEGFVQQLIALENKLNA